MPSIATLYRIAEALDMAPSSLLPGEPSSDVQVMRRGAGRMVPSSERPGSAVGRLVLSDESHGLEIYEYVTDPSADLDVWYAREGRKVLHLIDGALQVEFEGRDAVHLGPRRLRRAHGAHPHRWSVEGDDVARLFLVVVHDPA